MCALVMKSNVTELTPKARNWSAFDRLRWRVECLMQKLKGEI